MALEIIGESPKDLFSKLRLASRSSRRTEVQERLQMNEFLRVCLPAAEISFPVRLLQREGESPDFTLFHARGTLGIEATTLSSTQLHRLRSIQAEYNLGTICVTEALANDKKRPASELVAS